MSSRLDRTCNRPGEGETIVRDPDGNEIKLYDAVAMRSDLTGDIEAAPLWAGQGVGLVNKEQSAAEILNELVNEAKLAIQNNICRKKPLIQHQNRNVKAKAKVSLGSL